MTATTTATGRVRTIVTWALRIVLAAQFALAGSLKLAGVPEMLQLFDTIGIGQWFRYVTGGLEVAGAIGLLVPPLVGPAALGLVGVMIGAIFTDVVVVPDGNPTLPVALLVLAAALAWLRFPETAALVRRVFGRSSTESGVSESAVLDGGGPFDVPRT